MDNAENPLEGQSCGRSDDEEANQSEGHLQAQAQEGLQPLKISNSIQVDSVDKGSQDPAAVEEERVVSEEQTIEIAESLLV